MRKKKSRVRKDKMKREEVLKQEQTLHLPDESPKKNSEDLDLPVERGNDYEIQRGARDIPTF